MEEELLTTAELCEWLKVGRTAVWKWRKNGMPFMGSGKTIRYEKEKVLKWLNEREVRK